jgi:RimJ/RimL family protein N-acetyltransferase
MSGHRIGGERYKRLRQMMIDRYRMRRDMLIEAFMADGYPPGTEPLSQREQYQRLIGWQQAGDPRYWNNPAAQAALVKLATRYGRPPALEEAAPFGVSVANSPSAQLAGYLGAQKQGPVDFGGVA